MYHCGLERDLECIDKPVLYNGLGRWEYYVSLWIRERLGMYR